MDAAPGGVGRPSGPAPVTPVTAGVSRADHGPRSATPPPAERPVPSEPDTVPITVPIQVETRWWARRRRWGRYSVPAPAAGAAWIAGFVAVVALLASQAARLTTKPGVSILESDSATPLLQAQSVLQGHVLLNGWRMLYDSFWTVEVPYYTVGELFTGVNPVLMSVVPGVLAALVLLTAGRLAREGLRGGAAAVAGGAVVALIGLPSDVWAVLFLHGAWHVGTMLWCLLAFAGLRSSRWGAGWWVAVLLLTAGLLGDLQTISYGVGAVVCAGILASVRTRRVLAGAPAVTAGAAAVLAAYLLRTLFAAWGAYSIGTINAPASHDQRWTNIGNLPTWLPRVFGVGTGDWGHNGVPTALAAVRYLAFAAVAVAVLLALWSVLTGVVLGRPGAGHGGSRRRDPERGRAIGGTGGPGRGVAEHWRLDDMLLMACLADLAFYVYAAQSNLPGYLRYLAPFVVFGSLLAARIAGRWFAALPRGAVRRAVAGTATAVTVLFAASFVITSVQPVRPVTGANLASFLSERGLTNGIGTYWPASMTTVASHDTVTIRPITLHDGHIVRYGRQSTATWYDGQEFQFLVFDSSESWGGVSMDSVTATLGPPAHVYSVGTYRVLTWPGLLSIDPGQFAG